MTYTVRQIVIKLPAVVRETFCQLLLLFQTVYKPDHGRRDLNLKLFATRMVLAWPQALSSRKTTATGKKNSLI